MLTSAARTFRQTARVIAGVVALVIGQGAQAATIMKVETGRPGTATFLLSGSIEEGDAGRMRAALDSVAAGVAVSVILESPGGHLAEGLLLGTLFHEAKVTTVVRGGGSICYSACAVAFLGGREPRSGKPMRVKMSGGKLGFHQFARRTFDPLKIYTKADYDAQVAEAQEVTRDIVRYLKSIGEDLSKLQLMLRAPSEGMNVISNEECLQRGFHVLDEPTGKLIEAATQTRLSSNTRSIEPRALVAPADDKG